MPQAHLVQLARRPERPLRPHPGVMPRRLEGGVGPDGRRGQRQQHGVVGLRVGAAARRPPA